MRRCAELQRERDNSALEAGRRYGALEARLDAATKESEARRASVSSLSNELEQLERKRKNEESQWASEREHHERQRIQQETERLQHERAQAEAKAREKTLEEAASNYRKQIESL